MVLGAGPHMGRVDRSDRISGICSEGCSDLGNQGSHAMIMTRERDRVLVHVFSALGAILLWIGFWTTRIPPITIVDGSLNAENVYHGDKFRVRRIITGHRLDCGQPILESTLVDSYDIEHRYVAV